MTITLPVVSGLEIGLAVLAALAILLVIRFIRRMFW